MLACIGVSFGASSARAFSLLGPFQPWMEYTNGLRQPGDIGGPMDLTNEYRWNVPVVIYGFDKSFLDYFGSNGVAAVESAIKILNDLPPATQIVLTNYPFYSQHVNSTALAQNLVDLKSETLSLLLEQMGLAQPTRYTSVLKQWTPLFTQSGYDHGINPYYPIGPEVWGDWAIPDFIDQLNFDPITHAASPYVNNMLYFATISGWDSPAPVFSISQADPFATGYNAVADQSLISGVSYGGLTYDDVGGLAYLLSTNNINYETLLPGVSGVGANADSYLNGAWRPGVDKITFVIQPVDSLTGAFLPMTNQFTDTYITNGSIMQQQLARVIPQPDFLFCAGDVNSNSPPAYYFLISRTGTTNWINNATLNGNSTGAGPGVIRPSVRIVFNKLGRQFFTWGTESDELVYDESVFFGSFDGSTNTPISYPVPQNLTGSNQMTVRMWLEMGTYPSWSTTRFEWKPASTSGAQFLFQTSTNLTNWVTLFTNSNDGTVTTFNVNNPSSKSRFYRLLPQ